MIKNKSKNYNFIDYYVALLIIFCTVSSVFPPLRIIGSNAIICFSAILMWIVLTFLMNPSFYIKVPIRRAICLFFMFYTFLVPYLFGNGTIGNRYVSLSLLTFGYTIYEYYKSLGKVKIVGFIIMTTLPFAAVTVIRTAFGLISNPYLSRSIISSGEYTYSLLKQGIGGYELIYFLVLFSLIVLFFVFTLKRILLKILFTIIYIISFIVILMSNYLTAIIVLIFSSFLMLILKSMTKKNQVISISIWLWISILLLLTSREIFSKLIDIYISIFKSGRVTNILSEIRFSMISGVGNEFFADRWPTILSSILATLKHPILGLTATTITKNLGFLEGFGQHSLVFDTFALFGVFIGIVQIYIILLPFNKDRFVGVKKICSIPILLAVIFILFFNNATSSIAFVTCLVYPYVSDNVKTKIGLNFKSG